MDQLLGLENVVKPVGDLGVESVLDQLVEVIAHLVAELPDNVRVHSPQSLHGGHASISAISVSNRLRRRHSSILSILG